MILMANRSPGTHFSLFGRAIWNSCVELFWLEAQVEVARVSEDQGIALAKAGDLLPRRSVVCVDPTEEGLEGSQFFREGELAVPAGIDIVLLEVAKPVCVLDRLAIRVFLFHEDDGVADGMRCQRGYADVPVRVIGAFEELLSRITCASSEDTLV